MASVSQPGYLGIGTSDAKGWQDLSSSILGMEVVPGDDKSTSYLRLDECHHRVELRSNGGDDIDFAGWEVPDPETLQCIARQLEDGGVKVVAGTRDEADRRRVIDLGCHMNDRMVSFYLGNPSGFALEYGWGARMIDDAALQAEH